MAAPYRPLRSAALASLAILGATAGVTHAFPPVVNPNPILVPAVNIQRPALTLQQYTYDVRTLAKAYSSIPPYLLGYNPYIRGTPRGIYPTYLPPTTPYYNPAYNPAYNPSLSTAYNPYLTTPATGGNPYLSTNPGMYGNPSLSTTPGYAGTGPDPSLSTNPYNPYNPYYPPYDPSYGTLKGVADLTNATAQYYVTIQRARLLQEDVTRSRLETRRQLLEQTERERKAMPNPEELRQKDLETAVNRARHEPPLSDILSGRALNDLYNNLASQQGKGFRGPNVPLDEIDMTQINLSPAGERGNLGLVKNLKQGDKLEWPSVLLGDAYREAREKVDVRLPDAVTRLRTQKPVPERDIRDLEDSVKNMTDTLNATISDLSPSQYIMAKRYLNMIQDALTAMRAPGAIKYFSGTWTPKGKNVAELVNHMKQEGLQFAPATPGGEGAYRALHHALVSYDANMTLIAASK